MFPTIKMTLSIPLTIRYSENEEYNPSLALNVDT